MKNPSEIHPKLPEKTDNSRWSSWHFVRQVLIVAGIVALFALISIVLWYGAEVFLLIFASLLIAIFLHSLSDFLSRHTGLSENWALIIVLSAIIGLTVLGVWLSFDSMQRQFQELSAELPVALEKLREQLMQYPLGRRLVEQIPSPQQFVGTQLANAYGRVTGFFSTAFDVAVNILVVLIIALYIAFNPKLYNEGIVKLVPRYYELRAREILATMEFTLRRFLLGTFVTMAINGVFTALGLWLLGVPFAIPLGIITGLLNFIPNIGPIIAGVPAVLIALSQSPSQALYVFILYFAAQNLEGFVLTPLIQERAVSIPPVLLIAAQLLFAVLFGFLGLLLAVPLVAVIFVAVKMIYVEDILGRRVEVKGEPEAKNEVKSEDLSDG